MNPMNLDTGARVFKALVVLGVIVLIVAAMML
jgi:hypothetical protein